MKQFAGGECIFEVPFSTVPQKLQVGDPLVTTLPGMEDVYVSRNADQIYNICSSKSSPTPKHGGPVLSRKTAGEIKTTNDDSIPPKADSDASSSSAIDTRPALVRAATVPAPRTNSKDEEEDNFKAPSPLVALKDAILKESCKHERVVCKWYGLRRNRQPGKRLSGIEPMESWYALLPEDCRGLCVLFSGEKHLVHEDCREHLLSMLRKFPKLCFLILTNEDHRDFTSGKLRLNPQNQQEFVEVHMAMQTLTDQEAAQFFFQQVNRRMFRWGEFYGDDAPNAKEKVGSADAVLKVLEAHPWIRKCKGSPGLIAAAAECNNKGQPLYTELPDLEASCNSWD